MIFVYFSQLFSVYTDFGTTALPPIRHNFLLYGVTSSVWHIFPGQQGSSPVHHNFNALMSRDISYRDSGVKGGSKLLVFQNVQNRTVKKLKSYLLTSESCRIRKSRTGIPFPDAAPGTGFLPVTFSMILNYNYMLPALPVTAKHISVRHQLTDLRFYAPASCFPRLTHSASAVSSGVS